MKKMVFMTLMAMACVYTALGQSEVNLDTAIQRASNEVNNSLFVGVKVALLNCGSGSNDFSAYVVDKMTAALDSRKVTLVNGKDVDRVRTEMNLRLSGDINDTPAVELGKKLGAAVVVTGSFTKNGNGYRYTVKALDVNTKQAIKTSSINVKDDQQIRQLLGIREATAPAPAAPAPAPAAATAPAASAAAPAAAPSAGAYKIGDTGPAGGLIFYDKGNNNGGWRYLEAAPADIVRQMDAVSENIDTYYCTERAVGKGKSNTEAIMKEAANKGGGFGWAAQACAGYTLNGFSDWFLPSRDELHHVYGNLHLNGLGNFRNEKYWTSTAYEASTGSQRFWLENFSNGSQSHDYRENLRVRPIRQVAGQ